MFNKKQTAASSAAAPRTSRAALDAFVDVAAIEGSMIHRKDGRWAGLLEVRGEAFALLEEEEQDLRIQAFADVLNGVHPKGWDLFITRMVEPPQLGGMEQQYQAAMERWSDTPMEVIAQGYRDLMEIAESHVFAHVTIMTVVGKSADEAQTRVDELLNLLRQHGFEAVPCDAERLGVLAQLSYGQAPVPLEAVLNGPMHSLERASRASASAAARAGSPRPAAKSDPAALSVGGHAEAQPVLAGKVAQLRDVIEPAAVIEMPGLLDLGGVWAVTLVARAFPERAENGWMEWLYSADLHGVRRRVQFHLRPVSTDRALHDLQRRKLDLETTRRGAMKRGVPTTIDVELGAEAVEMLRQELGRGTQSIFETTLMVTLLASERDAVLSAANRLQGMASSHRVVLRPAYLEEALAFRSTLPWGRMVLPTKSINRALPTSTVASMFPFTAGEVQSTTGDAWGVNLSTNNVIIIDPAELQPGNMMVVARSRSGKSLAVKALATQALLRGDEDVMVIDPSPPIDYERWAWLVGGTYARLGPGSRHRINPLELRLPPDLRLLDDDMVQPVQAKVAFVAEVVSMMAFPDGALPPELRAKVEDILTQLYHEKGFTDDWESLVDRSAISVTPQVKPSPTLREAVTALEADPELRSVALRLKPFVHGAFDLFSGETTVDLSKPALVFNVYGLTQGSASKHAQVVAYAMIAEFIRWRLAQSGRRTLVIIDEAHLMFQRADTARFVSQLYRMAGKQGGRVALMTQGIVDIMGDPATQTAVAGQEDARSCMANTNVKLLMRNDSPADVDLIRRAFNLTPAEGRRLRQALPGEGVVVVGNQRAYLQFVVPEVLIPWIESNPKRVQEYAQRGIFDAMTTEGLALDEAPRPSLTVEPPTPGPSSAHPRTLSRQTRATSTDAAMRLGARPPRSS